MKNQHCIHIEKARHHNLKNIDIDIPRDELVVICGPSGSGKSTLAFDIVYAEGQRRYVESLSAYARQFLPQMNKPDVDKIEGLSPAISLEQQSTSRNPRSTVGTVTEIYDFLRVFFARLGRMYCPKCGRPIEARTPDEIISDILALPQGEKFMIMAPLVEHQKGSHQDKFKKLKAEGFARVRVDGTFYTLDDLPELDKKKKHCIDLVVDRLVNKEGIRGRLADSVELALRHGVNRLLLHRPDLPEGEQDSLHSTSASCPYCHISMPAPSPQLFSFNSPQGACPTCSGIGTMEFFEPRLIVPNRCLDLEESDVWPAGVFLSMLPGFVTALKALCRRWKVSMKDAIDTWPAEARHALFHGEAEYHKLYQSVGPQGSKMQLIVMDKECWPGLLAAMTLLERTQPWNDTLNQFRQAADCPACNGSRLRPEALSVRVDDLNIAQFCNLSIEQALRWVQERHFEGRFTLIAEPLLKELTHRLLFLQNVGLDYLSLGRAMSTLSGGEAQRIRLASQLGSGLVGVTYVLDEPSIGLHPRDNERLLATLRSLQQRGNTVLVVEHDEATICAADTVIELGPGSGIHGGEVTFCGDVPTLLRSDTLTARYLRGDETSPIPEERREGQGELVLRNVTTNNLKGIDCHIPLGTLTCVTGVSGSGKSSLVVDSLYKHLALELGIRVDQPGIVEGMEYSEGASPITRIVAIDQTPIGRTPRSNPATYTKIFDEIRTIFAATPDARKRGYKPGRFSFNVKGGRCEACHGDGQICVEMHFLPDVYVTCDICGGKRYNHETLEVRYKGLNIAEVLDLSVQQARQFFENYPSLARRLAILEDVGLDYIRLGQSATTLSGGEAQRIKISRELGKRSLPGTLYILDEPTTGLHMHEVGKLISVLHALVDRGATVVVIEHNTDMILAADHVIDMGPGGGASGGRIVSAGTPEAIVADPHSVTGRFLMQERTERLKRRV